MHHATEFAPGLVVQGIEPPLSLSAYKLIAFDMDSTLINIECVDEIADAAGRKAEVAAITEAAEILMGPHTPVAIGNFGLGPNAVLPTSRWARTYGPLSVTDFVKRSSIGYVTASAYPEFARHAHTLARYEGFSSHEHAVSPVRDAYLGR